MTDFKIVNDMMGKPPEEVVRIIKNNPQLAWNMYQTLVEVQAMFDDPTMTKEQAVGTKELVDHCADYFAHVG